MARGIQGQPGVKGLALTALWATCAAAQTPEPRALLERMAAAEKVNRQEAAQYVYREDIRYTQRDREGRLRREARSAYEVTILEGETYHRRIEQDGAPLSPAEQALEEKRYREVEKFRRETPVEERRRRYFASEENRFKFDTTVVLAQHTARLAGEETFSGRACWVLETEPKQGAPKPKRRSQWSLSQRLRYTVDKETHFPLRVVATQLYDFDISRQGTITEVDYARHEGVWLMQRIVSEGKRKIDGQMMAVRTEQTYSNYRRFTTSTKLLFEPLD